MTAFFALVRKDLLLYLGDRRAVAITLLGSIVLAAFFGYLMNPNSNRKNVKLPVAVVDLDGSKTTQSIVDSLTREGTLDVALKTEADAIEEVRAGKRRAAIVLPREFGKRAGRSLFGPGDKPEVTVYVDPSQSFVNGIVNGLLAQATMRAVFDTQLMGAESGQFLDEARAQVSAATDLSPTRKRDLDDLFASIAKVNAVPATGGAEPANRTGQRSFELPYRAKTQEVTGKTDRKFNSFAHSFAGMSVQFILFMGIEFGVGLLAMRRMGLWKRLRAAPVSRGQVLTSRIAAGTLIAASMVSLIYAAAIGLFGVRVDGSWPGFLLVVIAFSFLTASFGLLIAALGNTPEATRGISIFVTLILVMLGGAWVPSFIFPDWIQQLSLLTPTRWAVDGFAAMTWRGQGAGEALHAVGAMLLFACAFTAIALWRFRWEE